MSPSGWAQEYNGDFLQSGRPVFSLESLQKTEVKDDDLMWDSPYACGCDLASGSSADYSVAQFVNVDTGRCIETYRSKEPLDIFGRKVMEKCKKYGNAKLGFENNSGYGLTFMKHIKEYNNIYYQTVYDKAREKKTRKMGWNTNRKTKEVMITDMSIALINNHLKLTDDHTIKECSVFSYDDNDNMAAQAGFHDDCVMSLAIAWQVAKSIDKEQEYSPRIKRFLNEQSPTVDWQGRINAIDPDLYFQKQSRDWRLG